MKKPNGVLVFLVMIITTLNLLTSIAVYRESNRNLTLWQKSRVSETERVITELKRQLIKNYHEYIMEQVLVEIGNLRKGMVWPEHSVNWVLKTLKENELKPEDFGTSYEELESYRSH